MDADRGRPLATALPAFAATLVGAVLAAVMLAVVAVPAGATTSLSAAGDEGDPTLVWPRLLPPLPGGVPAEAARRCGPDGTVCLRRVEHALWRLADELGCDHRAVFATTYALLTRELRETLARTPDHFDDPAGIGLLAEVFHGMYERVLEAHEAGEPVPEAWRVAFEAAADGDHSAGQDMLLGINAHVQRDMPFAVASVGLRAPDGTSRKADHDRVNQVLRRAYDRIVPEVARRYDPGMQLLTMQDTGADGTASTQLVAVWREGVWRNAEHLEAATSAAHREIAATAIETHAHAWAEAIAVPQGPGYREVRREHCEAWRGGSGPGPRRSSGS